LRWGLLLLVIVGGVTSAEWFLRWRFRTIARSDRISPGLTRPDRQLGWSLTPSWQGTHQHHDFQARYSTNAHGFRGADARQHDRRARMIAILGDSFTFGTGVNDDEPFPARLDRESPSRRRVYNFAVPGYSTDQEILLFERTVAPLRPQTVIVAVYLGNDLFDNQLTAALQVRRGKPKFDLVNGRLILRNSPVVLDGTESGTSPTLLSMVLGGESGPRTFGRQLEARSYLFRWGVELFARARPADPAFEARNAPALDLFWAIVDRLGNGPSAPEVVLALLAGRSYVEAPGSLSAEFQEFFRRKLDAGAARHGVRVIDVASAMRALFVETREALFYANEGHLTAAGHAVATRVVGDALTGSQWSP
jgi:hypothetical protein